ncbi:unnamed protein product [Fraxinus pennsylvanica]|uniref:Uncharacterized protein n=1 Tax=Fraxinus pennsylvanica TaxID=56036 RepID=A0AAD2DVF1_9LAMI|nr:unnamed protein product [Fraxinus pennsylvanica]
MRFKKHPADLSSSIGVCASCLRERLFSVIAIVDSSNKKKRASGTISSLFFGVYSDKSGKSDLDSGAQRRTCRNLDRGMPPVRYSDEEDEHSHGGLFVGVFSSVEANALEDTGDAAWGRKARA